MIPIISAAAAAAAAKSPRAAMTITASETDGMDARERSHSSFKSTLFITLLIMIVDYVPKQPSCCIETARDLSGTRAQCECSR